MAKAIYDVQVPNIGEVERALGDLHDKAPRAMKNAVNQTATRAKNMMVRQARLRYQLNKSTWVDGEINSKEIAGTAVVVYVNAPSSGAKDTITGVRVYDNNGVLAGSQSVSLSRDSINAGLLRFTFPLIEVEPEVLRLAEANAELEKTF